MEKNKIITKKKKNIGICVEMPVTSFSGASMVQKKRRKDKIWGFKPIQCDSTYTSTSDSTVPTRLLFIPLVHLFFVLLIQSISQPRIPFFLLPADVQPVL